MRYKAENYNLASTTLVESSYIMRRRSPEVRGITIKSSTLYNVCTVQDIISALGLVQCI